MQAQPAPAPQGAMAPQGAPAPDPQGAPAPGGGAGSIVTPDSPVIEAFKTLAMYVAAQAEQGAPNSGALQAALSGMAEAFSGNAGAPAAQPGDAPPPPAPAPAPAPAAPAAPAPAPAPVAAAAPRKNERKGGPSTEAIMKSQGGKIPIM